MKLATGGYIISHKVLQGSAVTQTVGYFL